MSYCNISRGKNLCSDPALQSNFVGKFSQYVTDQNLNISYCIIVAIVFSLVIQKQPSFYKNIGKQGYWIDLGVVLVLLHNIAHIFRSCLETWFVMLFSAYHKKHPPIASHPNSHSPFLATQPVLLTHTVITTILPFNPDYYSHSAN